jgi:hypothetical protein
MRVLAARQLFEAAVCAHNPTRCVLRLETLVDVIHGVTMAVIAAVSHNDSSRRAAAVNVATAAAFVGADVAAASRSHNIADSPGGNRMIRLRDQTARWLCRTLPYPAGMR